MVYEIEDKAKEIIKINGELLNRERGGVLSNCRNKWMRTGWLAEVNRINSACAGGGDDWKEHASCLVNISLCF